MIVWFRGQLMERSENKTRKVELEIVDIDGISYYADKERRIFRHETIHGMNPEVVARWEWDNGKRKLVMLPEKCAEHI
jgi:hypothetical protein